MNLWDETLEKLQEKGFTFDDVLFIYGEDFRISKEDFKRVAKKTQYDNGLGAQEIASDITLLGNDFIMFREEYDGSEWWRLLLIGKKIPDMKVSGINNLTGSWNTLHDIIKAKDEEEWF